MIRKLVVGGCDDLPWRLHMVPKYTRPAAPIPADWPSGPAYKDTASTSAAPRPPICNGGNSLPMPNFKKIIDRALKNNRDLRLPP